MEKKSKVWIIVLAVLLAVTLALGVFCKLELDAANEKYRASRDETRALAGQVDQLTEELDQAKATPEATDPATQEPSAQPTEDTAAALNEELETLRQENQRLQAELDGKADVETRLANAQTELADTKAELDAVRAELTQTQTKLADTQKALEAYRLAFAGEEEGSRHSATALDQTVQVASDGVTATYLLENTAASGNSLSFRLEVAGEEVFASEKLAPGQSITTFQLENPLTAGEYEGALTVITYGKDGVASSKMTTPVTVIVE